MTGRGTTAYTVEVVRVAGQPLAAARRRTTLDRVGREIRALLEAPWALIGARPGLRSGGRNVAVYRREQGGISVEAGVQVAREFAPTEEVVCSATPAGEAARTTHAGPYHLLGAAHDALFDWCRERGLETAGVSWEVYGDHDDDPANLRTEVYCLLA